MGYQLIETIEVGSGGAASIEFTGIPQDGVDLVCLMSVRTTSSASLQTRFNSDSGSNYSAKKLGVDDTTVVSGTRTSVTQFDQNDIISATANTFASLQVYVSNYASTSNKSVSFDKVTEENSSSSYMQIQAGSYATSSAISSIQFLMSNFAQYSTASLYKITAD
jgi:hypothetical protein